MPNHISMHTKATVSLLMKGKRVNLATTVRKSCTLLRILTFNLFVKRECNVEKRSKSYIIAEKKKQE